MTITGHLVDVHLNEVYAARVTVEGDRISKIERTSLDVPNQFILPGFVDAHVHIESSMLVPTEFARMAVVHGTVATVSDPHEIGNVLGVPGVDFMIENGRQTPFKFYFGAPSCVPATTFETAGASIDAGEVDALLARPEIVYLAEMMNWPGVLFGDTEVLAKIESAKRHGKPVDGHAPGLMGEQAAAYVAAGMSTDHECFTSEEAAGKLALGMKILIREGSAARNFEALADLIPEHFEQMMFCSDDKHPDSLLDGHIDALVRRGLRRGIDLMKLLQMACLNPVEHYKLDVGLMREGDKADFIIVDSLENLNIKSTYIDGKLVAEGGKSLLSRTPCNPINSFESRLIEVEDLAMPFSGGAYPVIEVLDGELITNRLDVKPKARNGFIESDTSADVLKIAVVNRYPQKDGELSPKPALALIKNFGLKEGAMASSVAHDSHNVICVGTDDASMVRAINLVMEAKGGLSAVSSDGESLIPLPVAGLMSCEDGYRIAADYTYIDEQVKRMGSTLGSPFMSLSFMALLVIPSLKLSDLGLFDGEKFEFV